MLYQLIMTPDLMHLYLIRIHPVHSQQAYAAVLSSTDGNLAGKDRQFTIVPTLYRHAWITINACMQCTAINYNHTFHAH